MSATPSDPTHRVGSPPGPTSRPASGPADPTGERPLLRSYATFVVRHRRAVLLLALAVSLALGAGIGRLRVVVDPDRNLPQDHPHIVALNDMHRTFGDKNLAVIGLWPNDGHPFTPAFLGRVKRITDGLARIPGAVAPLLQSIASPAMQDVQPSAGAFSSVPVMERAPETQEEADRVRARVLANRDFVGTLLAQDGRSLAIYASFELGPDLPAYGDLHRAVLRVLDENDDGSFTHALSGPVVMASAVGDYAGRMVYYFPIALLVIALVHYDAFRTRQAIFLPLLTALLAVVWAVGLMGWLRVPLDPFNTTTPILILAVAAGHAVQILKRYYEELARLGDSEAAVVESTVRVGRVMIAAGTIAALSFLSLLSFDIETIRTFGVFTALGIVSTLAIELTIIPALRAALPTPRARETERERETHPWLDRWLDGVATLVCGPGAGWVVAGTIATLALCAVLGSRVEVDTSFKREFSAGSPVRVQDDLLNRHFAGTSTLVFLVDGPGEGAITRPEAIAAIDRFERRVEKIGGVGRALSIVDRLKTMHRGVAGSDARGELPDTQALATQYLLLYEFAENHDLSTLVTADNRIAKVVVLLHDDSTSYGKRVIAEASRILAEELPQGYGFRISGTLASNGALTDAMVEGKLANVAQITLITIVVAGLLLRSPLAGLLVAVPLALAVAIDFAVMGALGIPLDIVTSAVAAMSVGIGADYAVYFLFRLREELAASGDLDRAMHATLRTSGKAILFVSSAIALGYSTLCFSGFSFHVQLGALVALAMVTSSLATLLVLSALTSVIGRTPWRRHLFPQGSSAAAVRA